MNPQWKFGKRAKLEPERNAHEAEFFKKRQLAEVVVREAIQNSLDARSEDETVVVIFALGTAEKHRTEPFFRGLKQHLEPSGFDSSLLSSQRVPYLAIEDFGTTGLSGEIVYDPPPTKGTSNFYDFWWREGLSSKKERSGGRWGLGKTTLHMVSQIRTFWGYTVRNEEPRRLLMGKALLRAHQIGADSHRYCGYFVSRDDGPIDDEATCDAFVDTFSLRRGKREPGLSLVIPFCDMSELGFEVLARSVLLHYFFPLAQRKLEVTIEHPGGSITISRGNLVETATRLRWEGSDWEDIDVESLMDFAIRVADGERFRRYEVRFDDPLRPVLPDEGLPWIEGARETFNNGEPVQITFHVEIDRKGIPRPASYDVFLLMKEELPRLAGFWFRSGIRIIDAEQDFPRVPAMVLAVIEHPALSSFLGDCETPAHTNWNERTEGFKEEYGNHATLLRFIRRSVGWTLKQLYEPPREILVDLLLSYFSLVGANPNPGPPADPGNIPPEPLARKREPFRVAPLPGGFKVALEGAGKEEVELLPVPGTLTVAYDVLVRDPFREYRPLDFSLQDMKVQVQGGTCTVTGHNTIEFVATSQDFSLTVLGFDTNRDLVVDIRRVDHEEED